jgi:hypothetical protein
MAATVLLSSDKWQDWAAECTKAARLPPKWAARVAVAGGGLRGSQRCWQERCSPRAAAEPSLGSPPSLGSTPRPPSPRVPITPHRAAFHQVQTIVARNVVVAGGGGTVQASDRASGPKSPLPASNRCVE